MSVLARLVFLPSAVLLLFTCAPIGRAADPIGDKVVQFCMDNLGQKVGDGQCAGLAIEAVKNAGGQPFTSFKPSPGDDDYVWGDLVYVREIKDGSPSEMKIDKDGPQPGDVIQFGGARFAGKTKGGSYETVVTHHTAVVKAVKNDGKVLTVLEQNINGKMVVMEGTYRLNDLKAGWLRVYRPVK